MSSIVANNQGVRVEVSVFVYLDKDHPDKDVWVAYCPELDLVGSDYGEEAAKKSFEIVMKDYLDYTLEQGTLEEDLLSHGWQRSQDGRIVEPSYLSMVEAGKLDSVVSKDSYSKYSVPMPL